MSPLAVPALIVALMHFRGSNICILALLGATREQYHQPVPVLAEVDPIARTKIDSVLVGAGTHTFQQREVTLLPISGARRDLSLGWLDWRQFLLRGFWFQHFLNSLSGRPH